MRVHHLDCASLCPLSARLINGTGGWLSPGRMVCHCLLIETERGLVLVDTGIGLDDIAHPKERLGAGFAAITRPTRDPDVAAIRQIERLGFSASDVRHIVVTHLDLDHAGGLPDFPKATVHVFGREHDAAMARKTLRERERYRTTQWAHEPAWQIHRTAGESWFGFEAVQAIADVPPEVLLVPLHGHTRGHCGVAVRTSDRWLLHSGDAYFHHAEVEGDVAECPRGLRAFETVMAMDDVLRRNNQRRLRALAQAHSRDVRLICAHDPNEFDRCVAASADA